MKHLLLRVGAVVGAVGALILMPVLMMVALMLWPVLILWGIGWLVIRHYRRPKTNRLEDRLAEQKRRYREIEDRYILPLLEWHELPDSEANRALMKRWLNYQGQKSKEERQARDAALSALESAGFAQPAPRTFFEANAEMEQRISGGSYPDKDRVAFQKWLTVNDQESVEN